MNAPTTMGLPGRSTVGDPGTEAATIRVKEVAGVRTASPEYDDCVRLAREHGLSVLDVWRAIASVPLR